MKDIVQISNSRLVCTKCGGSAPLTLPLAATEVIKVIDQFRRGHGLCAGKKPTAMRTKTGKRPVYLGIGDDGWYRATAPLIQAKQSDPIRFAAINSKWAIAEHGTFAVTCAVTNVVLPSRANMSEHWSAKGERTRVQRATMKLIAEKLIPRMRVPFSVRFTRVAPRLLDSGDNDGMAFKAIRDGFCDAMGVSDGPKGGVTWLYASRKSERGEPTGFLVEVWR